MKKTVRIVCLLLCALMIVPLFACATNTDKNQSESAADTNGGKADNETEEVTQGPAVESKDYKKDFTVMYCSDIYDPDNYFAGEKEIGEPVSDSVYNRALNVKDYLNVEIKYINGGGYQEYYKVLQASTKSGSDSMQLVMTHPYMSIGSMLSKGDIMSFSNLTSIQTDASYWNGTLMQELSLGDEQYLGYNDFCLASCNVITYNKQMYENNVDFENPYELVDNHEWTLETLMNYANSVKSDSNGDGTVNEKDNFGFIGLCWVPVISFLTASNVKIVDKDDNGDMYVAMDKDYNEKMIDLVSRFKAFYKSDSTWMWDPYGNTPSINFTDGTSLFAMPDVRSLGSYQAYDVKFGILPYPLYDSKQTEYKTLNWNGYLAIPSNISDVNMVSDTIEMLAYYSSPVKTAYFEVLLGAKIADAPDDARMLELVWAGQVSDMGLVFSNISSSCLDGLLYLLPTLASSNNEYASYYKAKGKTATNGLNKFKLPNQ